MRAYQRVADVLRQRILGDELAPGERLPTERALCDLFSVSRITVRRALEVLVEEQLVRRLQGSGTFVSPEPRRRIPLMIDYTGSMRTHAPRLERRVLRQRNQGCPEVVASRLAVSPGSPVLYAERVDELQGISVACDRVYIPEPFHRGVGEKELAKVDFLETWMRAARFRIASCRQWIEAGRAGAAWARVLGLEEEAPVLISTEVYFATAMAAGLYISCYRPDCICIRSYFEWMAREEA